MMSTVLRTSPESKRKVNEMDFFSETRMVSSDGGVDNKNDKKRHQRDLGLADIKEEDFSINVRMIIYEWSIYVLHKNI